MPPETSEPPSGSVRAKAPIFSIEAMAGSHRSRCSETAIYVVSGHPEFVFLDDAGPQPQEVRLRTSPGDYIFVPPFVPHREENPDPAEEAVVVIARSTQEAIVVNLPQLYALPAGDVRPDSPGAAPVRRPGRPAACRRRPGPRRRATAPTRSSPSPGG